MYQRMFSYSIWARRNQSAAITLIVVFTVLIAILAFTLGIMANIWGFVLPDSTKWLLAAACAAILIFYPNIRVKNTLDLEIYYIKQKRFEFLLVCLGGVLWFFVGNQAERWAVQPTLETVRVSTVRYVESSLASYQEVSKQSWGLKKVVQHKLKKQIEKIKVWDHNSDAGWILLKFLLSVITIAAVIFLGYYVALLACSIACAGYNGAAVLFLIFGWSGLLVGGFYALKGIWRKWRRLG